MTQPETPPKYTVYQNADSWLPVFNWYWTHNPPTKDELGTMGHGPYPSRGLAERAARKATA